MKINRDDTEGFEICKRNEVSIINSKPILGIMDGDDIPEWLLIELLIRLPVKLIFRLKIVCKHWLSLILDPYFVRMYISRVSPLQSWVIVSRLENMDWSKHLDLLQYCESQENIYSRELKCPSYLRLHHPLSQPYQEDGKIYGISNGLVFYHQTAQHNCDPYRWITIFYICNPITGQWMVLRPPPIRDLYEVGWGFLTRVEDGMLKSFRVVCLDWSFSNRNTTKFNVYLSESDEWRVFNVNSDLEVDTIGEKPPIVFQGNLHWLPLDKYVILAYDPYQKPNDLRIFPLPLDKCGQHHKQCHREFTSLCGVSDGKLRYFKYSIMELTFFKIWILDDYSTGHWSLQNKLEISDIRFDDFLYRHYDLILPVSFDLNDSDIVYLGYDSVIVSYNIKTKRSEVHEHLLNEEPGQCPPAYRDDELDWRRGLVFPIPPWPTSIPFPPSVLLRKDKLVSPSITL